MACVDHAIVYGGVDEFRRFVEHLERQPLTIPEAVLPGLDGVRAAVEAAERPGIFVVGWGDVAYPGSSPYLPTFLKCMVKWPQLVHRYMEATTAGAIELIKAQIALGVDGIFGGNDWCFKSGPMFSPEHFQTFFVPHLKRIVEVCHRAGLPYIKHLDGNTDLLLPFLVEDVGIDALHGIEPSAGMEITKLNDSYKERIALIGTLDCGELLSYGSHEEITKEVKRVISAVSPGGGHIFSSSNGIHSGVPVENFLTMVAAVKRFGGYPIEINRSAL
jgi:uroporphyrinogen-III decarboxylase